MALWLWIFSLVIGSLTLENGLFRTPPMGWLAWERFRCNIDCKNDPTNCISSEELFLDMADRLVADGWRELGYVYVNIDDCWMAARRDEQGRVTPDTARFPGGIKALADYMHSRGLKLGIYSDLGDKTCAGYPGTPLNKVELDALTFSEWGIDMVKLDGCHSTAREQYDGYSRMSRALMATGRPIAFSCSWPAYRGGLPPKVDYDLLGSICNMWRNFDDITDSWNSVLKIIDWYSIHQEVLQPIAGPGHWNDPDMLVIGNFGLSLEQARTQMALWAILAAPLLMSNDLRTISMEEREILQNRLIIQINQDRLGIQGRRVLKEQSKIEVFVRPLEWSSYAIVFFNRRVGRPFLYNCTLSRLNIRKAKLYQATDVYAGHLIRGLSTNTVFTIAIDPSGVVMWHLTPYYY
ncbi:alpha-N-acetylgalactosaminidase isoform X2 [Ambystoma mexicanum]|uniref:alpha-N-acetylgalactosaminidase isoform X2 n=1 Tax=Ambystoma mexicanum TaxID=8296 RepID=UPI0037E872EC